MRLVALIILLPGRTSNSATVSSYEGFKFCISKMQPGGRQPGGRQPAAGRAAGGGRAGGSRARGGRAADSRAGGSRADCFPKLTRHDTNKKP